MSAQRDREARRAQALELVDPDEWNVAADAAARARAERRRARAEVREQHFKGIGSFRERVRRRRPRLPSLPSDQRHGRHAAMRSLLGARWGRILAGAVGALALLTIAGLVILWPGAGPEGSSQAFGGKTIGATVTAQRTIDCGGPTAQPCRQLVVRIGEGHDRGRTEKLTLGPARLAPPASPGDHVRVQKVKVPGGTPNAEPYAYAGIDRRGVLLVLAIAFALLVVVLARRRGFLALVGFAASLLLVTRFLVPAIAAGSPAMLVALVGSLAVMFITVGLTYGITPQSAAAGLGIAASLLFAAVVGTIAVHAAQLDGRSNDVGTALSQVDAKLSLQGVVLAGLVIAALGVLADMGVTQASAVMALRRANPTLSVRGLYREAFAVGRDHLVATTHTLVLVYVGATLPLLLILNVSHVSVVDAINTQDLAEPIVATLVGAMALLISVPLTTLLAAMVVERIPPAALPDATTVHQH